MNGINDILALCKKIELCKKRIAAERDKLRTLISDIGDIAECSDSAVHYLESAVDSLSEHL